LIKEGDILDALLVTKITLFSRGIASWKEIASKNCHLVFNFKQFIKSNEIYRSLDAKI
jgi:hypothetical protein